MAQKVTADRLSGVWSATPTPLNNDMRVDTDSVKRMVDHHLRLGVKGLFLAGSCGEGPWLPDRERRRLVETAAKHGKGKLLLAVQVTDNSALRIIDNEKAAKDAGADIAVIAPPYYMLNVTNKTLLKLYSEAIDKSPLPVGIYDRGASSSVVVPDDIIDDIYLHDKVVMVKDSSANPKRRDIALAARRKKPTLRLLNGDEFNCVDYLKAGYDGLLLGGGIFNGYLAGKIMAAVKAGEIERAEQLQQRMNKLMYAVYGGKDITCWLSGLKRLLVEMHVFSTWKNYPDYSLTDQCLNDIKHAMKEDADVLLP
jgi:4-hydroxy-tetrahydrodipicolinate synthase